MNLELEAYEGELHDLRRSKELYERKLLNEAYSPIQLCDTPETYEELNYLRQAVGEAQAKIHEMALEKAALESRLKTVNEITGSILKRAGSG